MQLSGPFKPDIMLFAFTEIKAGLLFTNLKNCSNFTQLSERLLFTAIAHSNLFESETISANKQRWKLLHDIWIFLSKFVWFTLKKDVSCISVKEL